MPCWACSGRLVLLLCKSHVCRGLFLSFFLLLRFGAFFSLYFSVFFAAHFKLFLCELVLFVTVSFRYFILQGCVFTVSCENKSARPDIFVNMVDYTSSSFMGGGVEP